MSNGAIDHARIEALLSGDSCEVDRYMLTAVCEIQRRIEDMPDEIAAALASQRKKDMRLVIGIASMAATIIALTTPYLLRVI